MTHFEKFGGSCPQCDHHDCCFSTFYSYRTINDSRQLCCYRCGFIVSDEPRYEGDDIAVGSDGKPSCNLSLSKGYGACAYQATHSAMVITFDQPDSVGTFAKTLQRLLDNNELGVHYLTRWNDDTNAVELVMGAFYDAHDNLALNEVL
jgi:hypothetical protein